MCSKLIFERKTEFISKITVYKTSLPGGSGGERKNVFRKKFLIFNLFRLSYLYSNERAPQIRRLFPFFRSFISSKGCFQHHRKWGGVLHASRFLFLISIAV